MIHKNEVENVIKVITDEIKDSMNIATIGLSGGADSTLVACLCVIALGKENVYGYGLPYDQNDIDTFNSRSAKLALKLNINYAEHKIDATVLAATSSMGLLKEISPLNYGNIKARIRMTYLYSLNCAIAEKTGKACRVVGTGNLSEDIIGYDTKGGDALADIFPIGELYKSEVYQLLDYFVEMGMIGNSMVDRIPSAGLWEGQTDADEIGYTYDEMEPAVRYIRAHWITFNTTPLPLEKITRLTGEKLDPQLKKIIKFVWNRHVGNVHKHEVPPTVDIDEIKYRISTEFDGF